MIKTTRKINDAELRRAFYRNCVEVLDDDEQRIKVLIEKIVQQEAIIEDLQYNIDELRIAYSRREPLEDIF